MGVKMNEMGTRRWRNRESIQFRRLVDGGILYDEAGGCVHHLNGVAVLIWEAAGPGATVSEMVNHVCRSYDAPAAQVEKDVVDIVRQLSVAGALNDLDLS